METETNQDEEQSNTNSGGRRGAWEKIRSENLPNERPTWAKLREQAQKQKVGQESSEAYQENGTMAPTQLQSDNIPRTREEMEQVSQRTRKNKYGDPLD